MTQKQQLIKYLKTHRHITVWTAMLNLGIARLSERIREIESDGVKIARTALKKDGKRVIAYSLE